MTDMPMHTSRELPMISLRQDDLPEIHRLEVGDKRYLVIKVEMVAKRSGKSLGLMDRHDQTSLEGDFQIHSIKSLGTEPVDAKSLESKEFQAVIAKVKSGQI